jgi:hypothetical protein
MAPLVEAAALACHSPFGVRRQIVGKWQGDGRRFPDDADLGAPRNGAYSDTWRRNANWTIGCRTVGSRAQLGVGARVDPYVMAVLLSLAVVNSHRGG